MQVKKCHNFFKGFELIFGYRKKDEKPENFLNFFFFLHLLTDDKEKQNFHFFLTKTKIRFFFTITSGLNFINILCTAFMRSDSESVKKTIKL